MCLSLISVQQHSIYEGSGDLFLSSLLALQMYLCLSVYLWWLLFRVFQLSVLLSLSFSARLSHLPTLSLSLMSIFIIADMVLQRQLWTRNVIYLKYVMKAKNSLRS